MYRQNYQNYKKNPKNLNQIDILFYILYYVTCET